ncbi:hypothetical protein H6762_05365 [Candidatus Nomurabacteria bacterium]|nr:hypothetical protein [Candidatus Nomurabacteria bacterium]
MYKQIPLQSNEFHYIKNVLGMIFRAFTIFNDLLIISKPYLLLITILALYSLAHPTETYSQKIQDQHPIGLSIQPAIAIIDIEAGEEVLGRIGVGKTIPDPVPIFTEVMEYSPPSTDLSTYSIELWDASDWVELDKTPIIIDGDDIKYQEFNVSVPIEVEPGTYFCTILFQPVMPSDFYLPESARVVPYIGSLLVVNVLGEESSKIPPEIKEFRYVDSNSELKQYFDTALTNNDSFYQEISGVVAIRSILGKEIAEIKVPKTRLLPGETESLELVASSKIRPGLYTAQMDLISDRGINSSSIFFISIGDNLDPAVMFITFVAIVTSLIILLSKYTTSRRRKTRKHKKP